MKKIIVLILAIAGLTAVVTAQKKTFLRIYNIAGHKFAKGFFAGTTDSSILLIKNINTIAIPVAQIGKIKTKRSAGNSILISTLIGAVSLGILGAVSRESNGTDGIYGGVAEFSLVNYSAGDGLAGGAIVGTIFGSSIGAIIGGSKKIDTYTINGKIKNWLTQRIVIDKIPVFKISVERE
jgi:hypothetical protein